MKHGGRKNPGENGTHTLPYPLSRLFSGTIPRAKNHFDLAQKVFKLGVERAQMDVFQYSEVMERRPVSIDRLLDHADARLSSKRVVRKLRRLLYFLPDVVGPTD